MDYTVMSADPRADKKARRAVAKQATRAFSRMFFALFMYTVVAVAVITAVQLALVLVLGDEKAASALDHPYVLWGLQVLSMYIIALPVFFKLIKKLPKREFVKNKMGFGEFVGTFFICEAAMLIGNTISIYICDFLSGILGHDITNATSDLILGTPIWIVIAVAVVIGPIVEELIFRKAMIDRLGMYGERFAVVVSAVSFGLFHGNLSQLIYATAVGLIFGWVYTKTGKIRISCMLHMLVNFMGTVPALLIGDQLAALDEATMSEDIEAMLAVMQDIAPALILVMAQYLFALIGLILFFKRRRNGEMHIGGHADIKLSFWKKIRCWVLNAGAILFLALCAAQILLSLVPATV